MSKSALAGLPEATLGVFTSIRAAPEIASFTLIGGTALALRLCHRLSEDLDFVTVGKLDQKQVIEVLEHLHCAGHQKFTRIDNAATKLEFESHGVDVGDYSQSWRVDGVKLQFFAKRLPTAKAQHAYEARMETAPVPGVETGLIQVATEPFIFATKAQVLSERLVSRDLFDIKTLIDSPVPFSLNQLWYDLYCTEFGTYYSAGSANPSDPATWAYETDANGNPLKGDAAAGIPPRFRKVKNVKDDPEKINYLPDPLNIRGPLEALGAKLRISRFDFLLKPGEWHPDVEGVTQENLAGLMKKWLGSPRPITILDLSGVPSTMTKDIIGSVLRVLYDGLFWARHLSEGGRERPLLVVMEEAHAYLNDDFEGAASIITQRIVKEGRKYGIGAMIVSQRPSEINPTILSQCGTFFAMRLSNSTDRSHVTGALSDNLEGLTNMLPILRTGEAIILGESVRLPMRTMIQAPPRERLPDSQDPVVCDEALPDESMAPGGWNIRRIDESDYSDFVETWLQQSPVLPRNNEGN